MCRRKKPNSYANEVGRGCRRANVAQTICLRGGTCRPAKWRPLNFEWPKRTITKKPKRNAPRANVAVPSHITPAKSRRNFPPRPSADARRLPKNQRHDPLDSSAYPRPLGPPDNGPSLTQIQSGVFAALRKPDNRRDEPPRGWTAADDTAFSCRGCVYAKTEGALRSNPFPRHCLLRGVIDLP